jgi:chemotaxis receptor (MCP) glutamine deamidase CheD
MKITLIIPESDNLTLIRGMESTSLDLFTNSNNAAAAAAKFGRHALAVFLRNIEEKGRKHILWKIYGNRSKVMRQKKRDHNLYLWLPGSDLMGRLKIYI